MMEKEHSLALMINVSMQTEQQVVRGDTLIYTSPMPGKAHTKPKQSGPAQSTWRMALLMEADRLSN